MLTPLFIAACIIDAAAMVFLLWRIVELGPRLNGVRSMLVPLGVLALTLVGAAQYYRADQPLKALFAAGWPIALVGGYGLVFLVCLIAKPRWN